MTQRMGSHSGRSSEPWAAEPRATAETEQGEMAGVGQATKQAGGKIAQTAAEQTREVVEETQRQARDLFQQGSHQLRQQMHTGQQRVAEQIRSLGDELHWIANKNEQSEVIRGLARQASEKAQNVAFWLQEHEPTDLLDETTKLARRHPGAFLMGAALAGAVVGRLTRDVVDAQRSPGDGRSGAHVSTEGPVEA